MFPIHHVRGRTSPHLPKRGGESLPSAFSSVIIDHAFNPGGPLDFGGLTSGEMCEALYLLGQGPMLGLDLVEVYPLADLHEASVHLLVWLAIYGLAGLTVGRRGFSQRKLGKARKGGRGGGRRG